MEQKEYRKLHSEWYEFESAKQDHDAEIGSWVRLIAEAGEPVLELGSGTGRLLVPLLERGIDICGIDTSADMMDRCRALCAARGLRPALHNQAMQEFTFPRLFGLVFLASGSLGLFTADRDINATFERVMAHLKPGGLFVYEFENLTEDRGRGDDRAWTGGWAVGPGDVVIAWRKLHKCDPASHIWTQLMIFEKFVAGRLTETEADERVGRFFAVDEAEQFARSAGFEDIQATGWLTDEPPRTDSRVVTIRCRKPRGRHERSD